MYTDATVSTADIRERYGIGDSSLYRLLQRHGVALRGRRAERQPVRPRKTASTSDGRLTGRSNDGTARAFRVSFTAVRLVEAATALDALRQVESLGATDILEISRAE